jgi:adenosylcobyric acid synthase
MNPILLKPSSNASSQVIVRDKIFAQLSAEDYFRRNEELVPIVQESYEILAAQNDLMIPERPGSPAEINLKDRDIVNLRMARLAGARCILAGDIDRGGVFASLSLESPFAPGRIVLQGGLGCWRTARKGGRVGRTHSI